MPVAGSWSGGKCRCLCLALPHVQQGAPSTLQGPPSSLNSHRPPSSQSFPGDPRGLCASETLVAGAKCHKCASKYPPGGRATVGTGPGRPSARPGRPSAGTARGGKSPAGEEPFLLGGGAGRMGGGLGLDRRESASGSLPPSQAARDTRTQGPLVLGPSRSGQRSEPELDI